MKLTVKVKLLPDAEQKQSLIKTIEVFNEACNYISQVAFNNKTFGQVGIHHLCYRDVRNKFSLSSQLTVRAVGKVSESYRSEKSQLHVFKKYSAIIYDQRLLSFRNLSLASILTVNGRRKIPIVFGSYAKLEQRRILGQADLLYQKGNLFLCLVIELPNGTPIKPKGIVGIDMGIVNIATSSNGQSFSGKQVDIIREKITKFKSALQKCGSKSAKKHLRKISGKEAHFKRNTNHIISKKIVQFAKDTYQSIAIENLKGFNGRQTVRKSQRERFGKWAFNQLRQFIEYKAKIGGIPVILVNPKNTSRRCSYCGHIEKANRKSQSEFVCKHCNFSLNADINAAKNIAFLASVNMPIVAESSEYIAAVSSSYKPPALAGGS